MDRESTTPSPYDSIKIAMFLSKSVYQLVGLALVHNRHKRDSLIKLTSLHHYNKLSDFAIHNY